MVKGISRMPLNLARLEEEDLVNIEQIVLRQSQCFDLPDNVETETDQLNQAFSSLALRAGEISARTSANLDEVSSSSAIGTAPQSAPTFGGLDVANFVVGGAANPGQPSSSSIFRAINQMAAGQADEDDGTP